MTATSGAIPAAIVDEHIARLQDLMRQRNLGAVIVFHTSNMLAFTGTPHASSDRLTCAAVLRDGGVQVIGPAFERPALKAAEPHTTIHTWEEHEDPYERFAVALRRAGLKAGRVGVDGRIWLESFYRLQAACAGLTLESAEALLREVRICKSPGEQEALRAAHRKGEQLFLALREVVQAGRTEREVSLALNPRFEQEEGFHAEPLVQSGPNGAIPHNPTGQRVLCEGDTVVIDHVMRWQAYNNDLTRTFAVGTPSPRARQAYRVVREAQRAAIATAGPGVPCSRLDGIARRIISDAGFGEFFTHRLGHGLGLEGHEPPYLAGGNDELLRPGMCCTVEPGIYVPGEFGIRIEDDILITPTGCEVIAGKLSTDVTDVFDR
jgi:Xaa-Pro aminopeptidase